MPQSTVYLSDKSYMRVLRDAKAEQVSTGRIIARMVDKHYSRVKK